MAQAPTPIPTPAQPASVKRNMRVWIIIAIAIVLIFGVRAVGQGIKRMQTVHSEEIVAKGSAKHQEAAATPEIPQYPDTILAPVGEWSEFIETPHGIWFCLAPGTFEKVKIQCTRRNGETIDWAPGRCDSVAGFKLKSAGDVPVHVSYALRDTLDSRC